MMRVDDFLGPYLPPGDLSLAVLDDAKKCAEGARGFLIVTRA
jgi:hypothetical protein